MIESKLSEMLEAKADSFELPPLVAVALSAATATALRVTSDQGAFAAFTLIDQKRVSADSPRVSAPAHRNEATGEPLTLPRLEQHVQCMRAHGVNVPDPEATPEGFIHPPPTKDASGQFQFDENEATPAWGSDAWYRVVFVTCTGPLPKP